jgi:hypothetical protein
LSLLQDRGAGSPVENRDCNAREYGAAEVIARKICNRR